jgi:RES domain-containing protein
MEIPDELIAELKVLPKHWNELPFHENARAAGDQWARARSSLGLLVPSAVLPAERNLLINPAHPEIFRVRIHALETDAFDPRIFH